MRFRRAILLPLLAAATLPVAAGAQIQIDKLRPAPAKGELSIENSFGRIVVEAWDRNEIQVRGTLAAGAEGLDFDVDSDGAWIDVDVPEAWFHASDDDSEFRSDLEVHAPIGSRIWVESVNADIEVRGFRGPVSVETVNGDVLLEGPAASVEVETMTGRVDVHAQGAPMDIESISGAVVLTGARGEVEVQTVSGAVDIAGGPVSRLSVETTTGGVTYRGGLTQEADLEVETFSGPVSLVLPAEVRAHFELQSFSGTIDSALGPQSPTPEERFVPYKRVRFSTGLDESEVTVTTHDGDITVQVD